MLHHIYQIQSLWFDEEHSTKCLCPAKWNSLLWINYSREYATLGRENQQLKWANEQPWGRPFSVLRTRQANFVLYSQESLKAKKKKKHARVEACLHSATVHMQIRAGENSFMAAV